MLSIYETYELRMKDQIEERSSQLVRNLSSCSMLSDLALELKQDWGDLDWIRNSVFFICKCELVSIRTVCSKR